MTPKILVFTTEDFRTADNGSRIRDLKMCSVLTEFGDVEVLTFRPKNPTGTEPAVFNGKIWLDDPRSRISSAASSFLSNRQYHARRYEPRRHRSFDRVAGRPYDLIYCSMLYSVPAAALLRRTGISSEALIVWDTHNYDPDVWRQMSRTAQLPRKVGAAAQIRPAINATNVAANAADHIIACTDADATAFGALSRNVSVIPNGADVDLWQSACRSQSVRPNSVAAFGSLYRDSTARGIAWFIDEVWPTILTIEPDATLTVTGGAPARQLVSKMKATRNAELIANPPNIAKIVCNASVIAIPEVWGTGSKLKMASALATRRPVVSTKAAATGLDASLSSHVSIADDALRFADLVLAGFTTGSSNSGEASVPNLADWADSQAKFRELLREVLQ